MLTISQISLTEWTELKKLRPSVFYDESFLKFYKKNLCLFLIKKKDNPVAAFVAYTFHRLIKKYHITPAFFPDIRLLKFDVKITDQEISETIQKHFKKSILTGVDLKFPIEFQGPQLNTYTEHILDLKNSAEMLFNNLRANHKTSIKKAKTAGCIVLLNSTIKQTNDVIINTLKENKASYNFKMLNSFLIASKNWNFIKKISIQSENKEILASSIIAIDQANAYYLLGGHEKGDKKNSFSGTYCLWNAILLAKENGCENFYFCGSSISSIASFFKGFGGQLVQGERLD